MAAASIRQNRLRALLERLSRLRLFRHLHLVDLKPTPRRTPLNPLPGPIALISSCQSTVPLTPFSFNSSVWNGTAISASSWRLPSGGDVDAYKLLQYAVAEDVAAFTPARYYQSASLLQIRLPFLPARPR